MEVKFYRCATCGQIIEMIKKKPCPVMCCGKPMEEIVPGTTDASVEKHVPVFEVKGWQPAPGADPVFARAGETAAANLAAEQLAELIAIQAAAGWELLFKTKLDFEGVAPAGIGEPPRGRAAALVFRKAK